MAKTIVALVRRYSRVFQHYGLGSSDPHDLKASAGHRFLVLTPGRLPLVNWTPASARLMALLFNVSVARGTRPRPKLVLRYASGIGGKIVGTGKKGAAMRLTKHLSVTISTLSLGITTAGLALSCTIGFGSAQAANLVASENGDVVTFLSSQFDSDAVYLYQPTASWRTGVARSSRTRRLPDRLWSC